MASPPPAALRYHAFDSLRAHMMLLGVLLHAAASYTVEPLGDAWPYRDPARRAGFDLLLYGIHVFRMPVFFVMAGFFGALLHERQGSGGFAANRVGRILIPFCVAVPVLLPVSGAGFVFANQRHGGLWVPPWEGGAGGGGLHIGHLWFLYYLLFLYGAALLVLPALNRVWPGARHLIPGAFGRLIATWPRRMVFVLPTAMLLVAMPAGVLETSTSLRPSILALAAYGTFFGFGWLLFVRRDLMPTLDRHSHAALAVGALLLAAYLPLTLGSIGGLPAQPAGRRIATAVLGATLIWLLVFALLGLYLRHLNRPVRGGRYVADASYWVYLVHLPIVIWSAGLVSGWQVSAAPKFAVVLIAATVGSLTSYHYLVRSTVAGLLLNGRKHPFAPLFLRRNAKPDNPAIRPSIG